MTKLVLPAFLYGRYNEVKRSCGRKLTALKRGASLTDLPEEWLDVDDHPGMFVLEGPAPILGGEDHFHCFALTRLLSSGYEPRLQQLRDQWVQQSSKHLWSFVGLLGQDGDGLLDGAQMWSFLEQAVTYAPQLEAMGARFSKGEQEGGPLWDRLTTISRALGLQGVALEQVQRPWPAQGGIEGLLRNSPGQQIRTLLDAGDIAQAQLVLGEHNDVALLALCEHFLVLGLVREAFSVVQRLLDTDQWGSLATWLAEHSEHLGDDERLELFFQAFVTRPMPKTWQQLAALGGPERCSEAIAEMERRGYDEVLVGAYLQRNN